MFIGHEEKTYCKRNNLTAPVLEYATCAWDPHLQKDIQQMEQVQRRAARFTFKNHRDRTPGCVETMLRDLGWERIEEKRQSNRLIGIDKQYLQ